jgi:hypothetical protein
MQPLKPWLSSFCIRISKVECNRLTKAGTGLTRQLGKGAPIFEALEAFNLVMDF